MKYVLFLGGRVGFEALKVLVGLVSIRQVFLEKEHAHETTQYSQRIAELCKEKGISLSEDLTHDSVLALCQGIAPDYLMCFGYRRLIRETVMQCAGIACIGSHFAPLPRYRGFAPLNWLLINGEKETAVNIFFLADEVDAGDIISRHPVAISETDDINTLTDKCVSVLEPVIRDAVSKLESGHPLGEKQDQAQASYTCSRNPDDGLIDWTKSSKDVYNLVRALTYPMPGAFTLFAGRKLYIWKCQIAREKKYEGRVCGKIIAVEKGKGFKVLTGDGSVWVTQSSSDPTDPDINEFVINSVRVTLGR